MVALNTSFNVYTFPKHHKSLHVMAVSICCYVLGSKLEAGVNFLIFKGQTGGDNHLGWYISPKIAEK